MMKQLLSGTAVALLLVAGPAISQTLDEEAPQTETQMQDNGAPNVEEEAGAHSTLDDDETLDADTADAESDLDSDLDTAQDGMGTDDLGTGTAQDTMGADDVDTLTAERPTETYFTQQEEGEILASELMNASVENTEGETLGSINDVIIDEQIGVKGVVIGVGGFLGLGQKNVAVNYDEIEQVRDESGNVTLVFAATSEELDEAPDFRNLQQQMADAEADAAAQQQQMQEPAPAPAPAPVD